MAVKNERGGVYDRFRNRLMFPIFDERKQVVAFGGRAFGEDPPKYLNSPETAIFSKGRLLYGLAQALPAIRQRRQVLIVEGYFDLLTLHRNGIPSDGGYVGDGLGRGFRCAALKGIGRRNGPDLRRGSGRTQQAALRSVAIFQQEGVSARIKILPPDSRSRQLAAPGGSGPV